ncbi:hypothetical protein DRO69_06485 [Candidatus Bathyarchaeota archaeon]|nr:MAG: hypothetical protein DRO69_06485 [Candidatus Bathyarchaeota archaeon]
MKRILEVVPLICIVTLNPPILSIVNSYAKHHPFIGSFPTIYVWNYTWFAILLIALTTLALTSSSWSGDEIEKRLAKYLKKEEKAKKGLS